MDVLNLFKKNIPQTIADQLNELLTDSNVIDSMIDGEVLKNPNIILYKMGKYLEYYIITRDKTLYFKYNELKEQHSDFLRYNNKINFEKNVITNGFLIHAANGYTINQIYKHGIGKTSNYNEIINNKLNRLDELLGNNIDNHHYSDCSYLVSSPGTHNFNYACAYSPERLFFGPLKQEYFGALPIRVGEDKIQYFKRVLDKKIEKIDLNLKDEAKRIGYELIEMFFSEKPGIVLVPINSGIKVLDDDSIENMPISFLDYYKKNLPTENLGESFFSRTFNETNNNFNNLECIDSPLNRNSIGIFRFPDLFTLYQIIAKKRNDAIGTEIDYFSGKPITKKDDIVLSSVLKNDNNIKEDFTNDVEYGFEHNKSR